MSRIRGKQPLEDLVVEHWIVDDGSFILAFLGGTRLEIRAQVMDGNAVQLDVNYLSFVRERLPS